MDNLYSKSGHYLARITLKQIWNNFISTFEWKWKITIWWWYKIQNERILNSPTNCNVIFYHKMIHFAYFWPFPPFIFILQSNYHRAKLTVIIIRIVCNLSIKKELRITLFFFKLNLILNFLILSYGKCTLTWWEGNPSASLLDKTHWKFLLDFKLACPKRVPKSPVHFRKSQARVPKLCEPLKNPVIWWPLVTTGKPVAIVFILWYHYVLSYNNICVPHTFTYCVMYWLCG